MPIRFNEPISPTDLGKEIHNIEFGDENGILANSEVLFERLKGINDSYSQRENSFMLLNGIDAYARSKTDLIGTEIKKTLYRKHNIGPASKVWDLMPDKEQIAAINTSAIVGQPEWLIFRINHLAEAARKAGQPLLISSGEIKLSNVVIRISNDVDLAVFYPTMSCEGTCETKNIDRVLSTFRK